jgi:hypothetical protein
MTKRTYTSKSGDTWSWEETKELREFIQNGNSNQRKQNTREESKESC